MFENAQQSFLYSKRAKRCMKRWKVYKIKRSGRDEIEIDRMSRQENSSWLTVTQYISQFILDVVEVWGERKQNWN